MREDQYPFLLPYYFPSEIQHLLLCFLLSLTGPSFACNQLPIWNSIGGLALNGRLVLRFCIGEFLMTPQSGPATSPLATTSPPRRQILLRPLEQFLATESASGIILMVPLR
jgi:hypothetical protein